MNIQLYTDGSGTTADKPGGWAAILVYGEHEKVISGGNKGATNNEMEITAVFEGLKAVKRQNITIEIFTDSETVIKWLCTEGARKTPYARRMCNQIDYLACDMNWTLKPTWVKGHSGHEYNERCDALAKAERAKMLEGMKYASDESTRNTHQQAA
jgi:ribonuclease HI